MTTLTQSFSEYNQEAKARNKRVIFTVSAGNKLKPADWYTDLAGPMTKPV